MTRDCRRLVLSGIVTMLTIACGRSRGGSPGGPPPVKNVTGAERLLWTQSAADRSELSTFRYALYVDGARFGLTSVSCEPTSPPSSRFECSAPLPSMTDGVHALDLTAFVADDDVLESAHSAPLQVNKRASSQH
jgi:hypothetical protein